MDKSKDILSYCANCMHDNTLQQELESKALALLDGPLRERDDYVKEKAIKSFSEGLRYLESSLLYARGIHPNQYDFSSIEFLNTYDKKIEEVRAIMFTEIKRQFRHFIIFL